MKTNSRIPRTISEFDGYLTSTDDYLRQSIVGPPPSINWQRLGLTLVESEQWHTYRQAWETDLYPKYLNKNTKTKTVNEEVAEAMEIFRAFAQPLLDIMAVSREVTQQDANALNFKIGRSEPTHPTTPIAEPCYVNIQSLGAARVKFLCRADSDSGRPALPPDADSVQIAYQIGGTPPANADEAPEKYIVTHASDIRDLGLANEGQVAYVFARWYSTRHPELAGVWCPMNTVRL